MMQTENNKAYIMEDIKFKFKGYGTKLAWRIALLLFLVFINISVIITISSRIEELVEDNSKVKGLSSCEYDYYNGDYAELVDGLQRYRAYDKRFDKYWEAAKAYENYSLEKMWQRASAELDPKNSTYKERAEYYKKQVEKAYAQCKFEENKPILEGFLQN